MFLTTIGPKTIMIGLEYNSWSSSSLKTKCFYLQNDKIIFIPCTTNTPDNSYNKLEDPLIITFLRTSEKQEVAFASGRWMQIAVIESNWEPFPQEVTTLLSGHDLHLNHDSSTPGWLDETYIHIHIDIDIYNDIHNTLQISCSCFPPKNLQNTLHRPYFSVRYVCCFSVQIMDCHPVSVMPIPEPMLNQLTLGKQFQLYLNQSTKNAFGNAIC